MGGDRLTLVREAYKGDLSHSAVTQKSASNLLWHSVIQHTHNKYMIYQ